MDVQIKEWNSPFQKLRYERVEETQGLITENIHDHVA